MVVSLQKILKKVKVNFIAYDCYFFAESEEYKKEHEAFQLFLTDKDAIIRKISRKKEELEDKIYDISNEKGMHFHILQINRNVSSKKSDPSFFAGLKRMIGLRLFIISISNLLIIHSNCFIIIIIGCGVK